MENHNAENLAGASALRRFFSLKWKALLFTSLVLVTVTVTISLRNYFNLHTQFNSYRQAAHQRYERDMASLLNQSLNNLQKLGSVIPSLPDMQDALKSGSSYQLSEAFDPQWPVLQLEWGIDLVGFYTRSGELLQEWGVAWESNSDTWIGKWVNQVNSTETEALVVNCRPECMQYAVVPMLVDGRSAGVVLVGSSLAEVVRDFKAISGNSIGLIVTGANNVAALPAENRLPAWHAGVVALTDKHRNLNILKSVDGPLAQALSGVRTAFTGSSYEIALVGLQNHIGADKAYLVVIADITKALREIRAASQEIFFAGGVGWVLAELLLLLILWRPMSRLRLTASSLPLLAQSRFEVVRAAILTQTRQYGFSDEIDILDETAIALANRLEKLEEEVANHTRMLSRRMEELSRERDFVASLLHTAQVMIVTQDRLGRIVMINPFVTVLTGFSESELLGNDFFETLFSQRKRDLRRNLKDELAFNQREHLRQEALVTCKDGSIRNVTWYHSRLSGHAADDPVILSVGLDITERRGAESRLKWMADHDTLTGLINRRRFQDELEFSMATAQHQNKIGALLIIDLDQFKYVNDAGGHYSGDALLKGVAKALSMGAETDVVARLSGDEFAVLVRDTDAAGAVQIAKNVCAAIENVSILFEGQALRVSASVGLALFPTHANNVGDLMASADLAMYQAKEDGRGHWHVFSEDDQSRKRMRHRIYWRERVSKALEDDKFVLYFQPIMEIETRCVAHYEVLLRMQDDNGSVIGPVHFIDAAERGGMIHAVDRLVVSKAIRCLAELTKKGLDVSFSINLSGYAFSDPQLLPHIKQELERNRVQSSRVIFEITETAAVSDFAVANSLMLAVKELGCQFALDDFGIGFSSFYYLKHLPVDYLKIDGSFIRQLPDSLDDQIIVRALSQVATGFGKKTIAEYVETETTLRLLHDYGIDFAQGFLISKPMSSEEAFK